MFSTKEPSKTCNTSTTYYISIKYEPNYTFLQNTKHIFLLWTHSNLNYYLINNFFWRLIKIYTYGVIGGIFFWTSTFSKESLLFFWIITVSLFSFSNNSTVKIFPQADFIKKSIPNKPKAFCTCNKHKNNIKIINFLFF